MRENINDLQSFVAVARARSFTRAAAQLGVSQSALSHAMRALEERLGIRLLNRTTRNVALTVAGERLLKGIGPRLEEIESELTALTALRDEPAGSIRLVSSGHAANFVLWPKLDRFMQLYPDIQIELAVDNGLTNIVAERFDAGVRLGEQVGRDMIAVPIGPQQSMAVVGSADYLARFGIPLVPQDLAAHRCINLRFQSQGGLYAWEFEKDGRALNMRVEGQFIVNESSLGVRAALAGHGLTFTMLDHVQALIDEGQLVRVLADWCPAFSGLHLYYPSRRQQTPAFSLLVEALRFHER